MSKITKPKIDDKQRAMLKRLRGLPEGTTLLKYLNDVVEYEKEVFVTASLETVQSRQGRVQALQEIISLITE